MSSRSEKQVRTVVPEAMAIGAEHAYHALLAEAEAIAVTEVVPYRGGAAIGYHNVRTGVASILFEERRVRRELPMVDFAAVVSRPVEVGQAVLFAAARAARISSAVTLLPAELLNTARTLRAQLLEAAEGMADHGLLPSNEVAAIRAGSGFVDMATDCVDLAALYREHRDEIADKCPISPEQAHHCGEAGAKLLEVLAPDGGRAPGASPKVAAAYDLLDRMWTRLIESHQLLRRTGGWLWGDRVDDHVPPLRARLRGFVLEPGDPSAVR